MWIKIKLIIFRFVTQKQLSGFQLFFSALANVSCHIFKHLSKTNRPRPRCWRPQRWHYDERTKALLRKISWKEKAGCVNPVGRREETLPLMHKCIHEWERDKELANEPVPAGECVSQGYKVCSCLCRWGQKSQPADASGASRAGSQEGRSQTLIGETHHTAFPVFTKLWTFLTVYGIC